MSHIKRKKDKIVDAAFIIIKLFHEIWLHSTFLNLILLERFNVIQCLVYVVTLNYCLNAVLKNKFIIYIYTMSCELTLNTLY